MTVAFIDQGFVAAVNHVLARSDWARERLQPFSGQQFRIDAGLLVIDAGIADDGLLLVAEPGGDPEVTLAMAVSDAPLLLSGGMDRLMNRVRIAGNAEFAEALGFVFRNLSWDVEEDLSRLIGDIPAHRVIRGVRDLGAAQSRAVLALGENFAEYLTEEGGMITARGKLERFRDEVTALRDRVARIDKRIARLSRKTG